MRATILCLVVAFASACGTAPSRESESPGDEALVKIAMCSSAHSATQALPVYAQDNGLFRRYGLDVSMTLVTGGSRAVPALTSGSVQFCVMAGGPVANAVLAGAHLVVVGSLLDAYTYSLIVSKDIRRPADLSGKAVAISTPGSASATAMEVALETLGLRPGRDVSMLALGDYRQRSAAMEAGYVAGTVLDYPDLELARQRGLRTLLDMAPLNLPTLQIALVTDRTFLNEHRPIVLRFVQAISHAMAAMRRDRSGAVAAVAKYSGLDPKEHSDVLEKTYEAVFQARLKKTPAVSLDAVHAVLKDAARNHPKASEVRPDVFADLTLVDELARSGFFETLEP
jgi:NitT/TauT family transport system substrate-binding protein